MNYDTSLFIEIIEGEQGVTFVGADFKDGIHIRKYIGPKGKLVMIETTDMENGFITPSEGRGILTELGLDHLGDILFSNK